MAQRNRFERWTRLAREARAAANMQRTTHARQTMLELAQHYDGLAKRSAEVRRGTTLHPKGIGQAGTIGIAWAVPASSEEDSAAQTAA